MPSPQRGAEIPELERQMPQSEEWAVPPDLPQLPTPPVFGLLYGGEVAKGGKEKGQITPFEERPDPRTSLQYAEQMGLTARIVGEREGGPELALLAPGSKVIPLSDEEETGLLPLVQGAAGGASLPYDPSTTAQAMAPVWEHLGFEGTPSYRWNAPTASAPLGRGLTPRGFKGGDLPGMRRMGIEPRLVRDASTGRMYYVNPSGVLQPFGPTEMDKYGFQMSQMVNLSPETIRGMGPVGRAIQFEPPPQIEPGVSQRRFPALSAPLIMPLSLEGAGGYAMPAMRTIASLWPTLSPAVQDVITSAFGVAGITPATMEAERRFFTPSGRATAPGAAILG
ncbi:MAG: hypothetical protein E3J29_01925 [Dehalococcoidia bacterium]|nr:MAG: hypothetical protein E3J29_01925 [Dehalococcoidia bacterium]